MKDYSLRTMKDNSPDYERLYIVLTMKTTLKTMKDYSKDYERL